MTNKKFETSLGKIQSGQASASELITLFRALLRHKLSAQQQLDVCQYLAQQQRAYAITANAKLEGWVADLVAALTAVGADERIVRDVSGALTFGTHLHDEKFAMPPEHSETTSLTVALHIIFFGHPPEPAIDGAGIEKKSAMLTLIISLKTNLGAALGWSVTAAMVVALVWIHFYPISSKLDVCPDGAQSVHGKLFLPLRDGTEVILSEGSALCYCQPFNIRGGREVGILKGSAYFEIASDANHPFFINTPAGTVEIRGTGLNVDVNHERQTVDIATAHGVVLVHHNGETTEVPPGQQLSISMLTGKAHIENFDPSKVTWPYPTRLVFNEITLEQFAAYLKERFHVTVIFKDEALKKTKITDGFYSEDIQLHSLVTSLDILLPNIKLTLDGTTIKISQESRQ
jgi:ferric-dicitrate binding protein FerR (iron transport regulator)